MSIILDAPPLIAATLSQNVQLLYNDDTKRDLSLMAVVDEIDRNPGFAFTGADAHQVIVTPERSLTLFRREPISDRGLRRFIARQLYESFARTTLKEDIGFGRIHFLMTGRETTDFVRNLELLEDDEYLIITGRIPLRARPRAKLIREVERYGAAREDVVTTQDYVQSLAAYEALAPHRERPDD